MILEQQKIEKYFSKNKTNNKKNNSNNTDYSISDIEDINLGKAKKKEKIDKNIVNYISKDIKNINDIQNNYTDEYSSQCENIENNINNINNISNINEDFHNSLQKGLEFDIKDNVKNNKTNTNMLPDSFIKQSNNIKHFIENADKYINQNVIRSIYNFYYIKK